MRKISIVVFCFVMSLFFSACRFADVSISSAQSLPTSSYYFSGECETDPHGITRFDSLKGFTDALTETDHEAENALKNFNSKTFVHPYVLHVTREGELAVPCLNKEQIKLRDEDGFSAIVSFRSELFDRPWVWFYSGIGHNYIMVQIMYLDDLQFDYTKLTCSELVARIAPKFPNVNNPHSVYEKIYEGEVLLVDRTVSTLVHKKNEDPRLYTSFVYDDMFIRVVAKPNIVDEKWFSQFSIQKIAFDQISSKKE